VSWDVTGKSEKPAPDEPDDPDDPDKKPKSWLPFAQSIKSQTTGWQLVMGYDSLTYDGSDGVGSFVIHGLKVWRSRNGDGGGAGDFKTGSDEPLAQVDTVTVRRIVVNEDL
jgi:hypothetical protein